MLITKEIYETLSETSRFLKYNAKEKVWEEVSCLFWDSRWDGTIMPVFLTCPTSLDRLQISPMAARDKCGHA